MVASQSVLGVNRGMSSNFWWLMKSANHAKFTGEYVMCMKKHGTVKNCLQMG